MLPNPRQESTLSDIREMRVSKSTKASYKSDLNQIKKLIPGALAGYRSAIKDQFKRESLEVPPQYESDVKDVFQGGIKESGKRKHNSYSTINGFSNAMKHIYKEEGSTPDDEAAIRFQKEKPH
ncbi:hypothetical protein H257_10742 [Aphanomyces astaci]|uniref:Uncharacterized protein n=1 Tax=Aphanomyces astaci TaxID=112090 RepID=W4G4L5_APHAT|nr:hypothetical protein H257_10742 [Aphanomyces astaci]ETV74605.1 hypothetical protein H257_10742 [Aphanomyces astaci]|eukprot:XP_009835692.1 hypothetical protein H257_10742 [Aphanomyces astaci]